VGSAIPESLIRRVACDAKLSARQRSREWQPLPKPSRIVASGNGRLSLRMVSARTHRTPAVVHVQIQDLGVLGKLVGHS